MNPENIPSVRVRPKKPVTSSNGCDNLSFQPRCIPTCPGRARVGVSRLSVPLVWNSDEHFGTRGECRIYSMFVVVHSETSQIDSCVVNAIDRTCTDVVFPDSFIFENRSVNFEIGISLYSARTDGGDINQSLKQKLTRSFGRRLGASYVTKSLDDSSVSEVLNPGDDQAAPFHLLGHTTLRLTDAKPKTGIYDLHMLPTGSSHGPPLYGHIRCRLVAQPNSVVVPLADGTLSVKVIGEECFYQNIRCQLRGGVLRSFLGNSLVQQEEVLLQILITEETKVQSCKHPRSVIVTSPSLLVDSNKVAQQFILTSDSEEDIEAWKHALNLQITDCEQWGQFARCPIKLAIDSEVPEVMTLSRSNRRCLYDEIDVNGTVSGAPGILKTDACRNFMNSSKAVSFAPSNHNQTAPGGRTRTRTNIRKVFQPSVEDDFRYVINLSIGEYQNVQPSSQAVNGVTNNCESNGISKQPQWNMNRGNSMRSSNWTNDGRQYASDHFLKGFKRSVQRSFGAFKQKKSSCVEVSHF